MYGELQTAVYKARDREAAFMGRDTGACWLWLSVSAGSRELECHAAADNQTHHAQPLCLCLRTSRSCPGPLSKAVSSLQC
ncbi:hypothetical protein Y032_0065g3669 [Ancylostoma ceylanicum]|uniref:Uncharacterized protein n=1 Tax=Ancylostoma ceylanicum TaxID=53326 RepID=A0A016U028_9BILA|nr:hypothetical protein Y032_0065g3669 [Ancylostoma ceylanicum]